MNTTLKCDVCKLFFDPFPDGIHLCAVCDARHCPACLMKALERGDYSPDADTVDGRMVDKSHWKGCLACPGSHEHLCPRCHQHYRCTDKYVWGSEAGLECGVFEQRICDPCMRRWHKSLTQPSISV